MHINFEFKARCNDLTGKEKLLLKSNPLYIGTDHQKDTYFNVMQGRMKLREGNIENALIHYQRPDTKGAKQSNVSLYQHQPDSSLIQVLEKALGVLTVVDKTRKIYFIDHVKFHFDEVKSLGSFIEVEAIDKDGTIGIEKLKEQCSYYANLFGFTTDDFIPVSYSDLLLAKKSSMD